MCIATWIATPLNLRVFAAIRRQPESSVTCADKDVDECPRMPKTTLGVKWSQVKSCQPDPVSPTLSARPENTQVERLSAAGRGPKLGTRGGK